MNCDRCRKKIQDSGDLVEVDSPVLVDLIGAAQHPTIERWIGKFLCRDRCLPWLTDQAVQLRGRN